MAGLISINKPHTDNIFSGDKSLEWRKKALPEDLYYVYETKNKGGCGMVIGEMLISGAIAVDTSGPLEVCLVNAGCVHPVALKKYANNGIVYANFIQNARLYDNPKPLKEFYIKCNEGCENCHLWKSTRVNSEEFDMECTSEYYGYIPLGRPPQSWCHVEELL